MNGRFFGILKGTFFALIFTVMLAALLAAVMYFAEIPDAAVTILIFVIGALSVAAGAFGVSKAAGSKGLATGAAVGFFYYIVLAAAALIIKKELALDTHMAIMFAAAIISGMLGGVLGV